MFDLKRAEKLLSVPESFVLMARSFPEKVDSALALLDNADDVAELLQKTDAMEHYAKRIKVDTETANLITYGKLKIQAKLGDLMKAATPAERGATGGRGNKASKGALPAFSKPTAAAYRRVAESSPKIAEYFEEAKASTEPQEMSTAGFLRFANGTEKAGTAAHVSKNTGIPEWYTPAEYIDAAREALGEIELDPATAEAAQQTVKAKKFYTVETNGLTKKWKGRCWLNPPYSSDLCPKFVDKLCEHVAAGDVPEAILLVNNATETKWFQRAAAVASAICFPAGRVKFLDDEGKPGAPLQGQAILYFGASPKSFSKTFQKFGFCSEVCK